jgi:hypothetical protein
MWVFNNSTEILGSARMASAVGIAGDGLCGTGGWSFGADGVEKDGRSNAQAAYGQFSTNV